MLASGFESVPPISPRDLDAMLSIAHGVGTQVLERLANGDPTAQDFPVAAVAYDLRTGNAYPGYAQDQYLGDPTAHAERMAAKAAKEEGVDPDGLIFITGLEPCDDCLIWMGEDGVPHVTYVVDRQSLALMGLVKAHPLDAFEQAARGRAEGRRYPTLSRVDDPNWQGAFLSLFANVHRDPISEAVTYKPKT